MNVSKLFNKKTVKTLSKYGRKALWMLRKHGPDIAMAIGIGSGGAALFTACKETRQLDTVIEPHQEKIEEIHRTVAEAPAETKELVAIGSKRELTCAYTRAAVDVARLYGPAIGFSALSVAGVLGSYVTLRRRHARLTKQYKTLVEAYATMYGAFQAYRSRVAGYLGADNEQQLYHGIATAIDSETGEEVVIEGTTPVSHNNEYQIVFDEECEAWNSNPDYAREKLANATSYLDNLIEAQGYAFGNDLNYELGIPFTKTGQIVGWINDPTNKNSDCHVDLRITEKRREYPDGSWDIVFYLDPNYDGPILDRFEQIGGVEFL